jgi:hypothetical protein
MRTPTDTKTDTKGVKNRSERVTAIILDLRGKMGHIWAVNAVKNAQVRQLAPFAIYFQKRLAKVKLGNISQVSKVLRPCASGKAHTTPRFG